ncbi:hypothetical protein HJFPF1_08564 [Paramyrothecium foliicola]|nr:hypothetical protein HJFPF1_08564 [Paramyrothecium foliicola]
MLVQSTALLGSVALAGAAKVGYFDSENCVDTAGMEACYATAESSWAECIANATCRDAEDYCERDCSCTRTQEQMNCAASHCWDRAYSCEYQLTVGDLETWCSTPDYSNIPFYPPPNDAPGSCSCNYLRLLTSYHRAWEELGTCGRKEPELAENLVAEDASTADSDLFSNACICCGTSAELSASFYEACPSTDFVSLPLGHFFESLKETFVEWQWCGDAMAKLSCGPEGFDFTPPGGNSSASFYRPNDFPASGTLTTSNLAGVITSPISGETFTWTHENNVHAVTVASADARPTGETDGIRDGKNSGHNIDEGNSSSSHEAGETGTIGQDSHGNGTNAQGEENNGDKQGAAFYLVPGILMLTPMFLIALMV